MKEDNKTLSLARNEISSVYRMASVIATISTGMITHKAFEHVFLLSVQHEMVHCIFVPFDWLQVTDADCIRVLAFQVMASYDSWAKHCLLICQSYGRKEAVPYVVVSKVIHISIVLAYIAAVFDNIVNVR
jgi:hypothetical protein